VTVLDDARAATDQRLGRTLQQRVPRFEADPAWQLPAGPKWPAIVQSFFMLRYRHIAHPWLWRKYGDTFTVRLLPSARPMVFFTRPEHIRDIFAGDPKVFHAGHANAILAPIMGRESVLLLDELEHSRSRRLLMPAFTARALKEYGAMVRQVAVDEVEAWQTGATFTSLPRMNALTLEVILRVVFGVTDEERLARLRPAVAAVLDIPPIVILGWGHPTLLRFGPWKRMVENQYALDALIFEEIADRRGDPGLADRRDVLSRLLLAGGDDDALTDSELRDQLVTLLLAGHETTATSLSWAMYELGRDQALLARAQQAADEGDDDYLEALLKETMRVHPVLPAVNRTLMAPARVGDLDLPAGVIVAPSIIISHQRDESFPEHERFDPERFLGENPPPANSWIPFGGGVRRCLGAGFSLMEGVHVLRELLVRYGVEAVGSDKPKTRNIVSIPAHGGRVKVTRR